MDWLTEPLSYPFMQRALVGGILAAVSTSVTGTWVILRGMSFLGDALVHGVIPGIALAAVIGFSPTLGAIIAAVLMIGGINLIHRQTTFSEDTGIGLLFVGMLALGVLIVSSAAVPAANLERILFGDALGVGARDLPRLATIAILVVGASVLLYRAFLVLAFNEAKAQALGLRPRLAHGALLALITLSIVGSFQSVGTLLVFALLVAPPATAALIARRVPTMMLVSVLIGVTSVAAGLLISYHADTSGSATMALLPVLIFFVVLAARSVRPRHAKPAARNVR
ncbi:MAG: zinc ABC transporter permease AztB [Acidimicrobiia bacterium]|nr:zinc ABC transporter permease AztB [Acidimicrobiia bacterium]